MELSDLLKGFWKLLPSYLSIKPLLGIVCINHLAYSGFSIHGRYYHDAIPIDSKGLWPVCGP